MRACAATLLGLLLLSCRQGEVAAVGGESSGGEAGTSVAPMPIDPTVWTDTSPDEGGSSSESGAPPSEACEEGENVVVWFRIARCHDAACKTFNSWPWEEYIGPDGLLDATVERTCTLADAFVSEDVWESWILEDCRENENDEGESILLQWATTPAVELVPDRGLPVRLIAHARHDIEGTFPHESVSVATQDDLLLLIGKGHGVPHAHLAKPLGLATARRTCGQAPLCGGTTAQASVIVKEDDLAVAVAAGSIGLLEGSSTHHVLVQTASEGDNVGCGEYDTWRIFDFAVVADLGHDVMPGVGGRG